MTAKTKPPIIDLPFLTPQTERRISIVREVAALIIIFGLLALLATNASQMLGPYKMGETLSISLSYEALPGYAIRTVFISGL